MEQTPSSSDQKLFYVDADIRIAESLPTEAFNSKEFLNFELKTLFPKVWLFLPQRHTTDLRTDPRSLAEILKIRGTHIPFSLLNHSFFLQRDWKGKLHCFPNICTHAWYPLVEGIGRERKIVCAQHGRQFDCSGRFLAQNGFNEKSPDFPRVSDHLTDLALDSWLDFFFVSLAKPIAPLNSFFGEVFHSTSHMNLENWKRYPQDIEVREVDGNWKQHAWNYMDKFHITFIHRAPEGLVDALEMGSYQTEVYPFSALQWAYAKKAENGFEPDLLPPRFRNKQNKRVFALWWFIFPNLTLNFYPWGLSINVYMPVPDKPEKTLFLWYHYVRDEKKYQARNELWLSDQVDQEDIDALTQVKRNLNSSFAPRGRFAPTEEIGPHWFHRLVFEMLFKPSF